MYKGDKNKIFGLKFYINYEECKYLSNAGRESGKKRFILTMRNVNGSNSYSMKEREGGFILTMRNVNDFMGYSKKYIKLVLY